MTKSVSDSVSSRSSNGSSSSSAGASGGSAGFHIDDLRRRLLDLKNSNRLLNLVHSDRSKTQIRVIDEVPDFLFRRLQEGASLTFRAVEEARPREGEVPSGKADVVVAAEEQGLHPTFELPEADADSAPISRHVDEFIQTLHFPQAMERKLNGIRDATRTALQEMGVNTLYAAFGFLEWFESDVSEKAMLAPLFLLPLEIERKLVRGTYEFGITSLGEDPEINLTLSERMNADFGFRLPEFGEDETPSSYFARVRALIEQRRRWCVRRFITVGNFAFARLVMYRDLDQSNWVKQPLAQHSVVRSLLTGSGTSDAGLADTYDVDSPAIAKRVPALVADADSSQISALVDVVDGKNLALKGPPGTGKSQTITNMIASALGRGKSVLFVAEKMAALEVVKKRLDGAGLGHFCLELHSTKAKKTDVLESLKRRIELYPESAEETALDASAAELRSLRDRLNQYCHRLNSKFGALGLTVQELLWREQQARCHTAGVSDSLTALAFPAAASITRARAEDCREKLLKLEARYADVCRDAPDLRLHPWRFVTGPVDALERPRVVAAVRHWHQRLSKIGEELPAAVAHVDSIRIDGLPELASSLSRLPAPDQLDADLLLRVRDSDSRRRALAYLKTTEEVADRQGQAQALCHDVAAAAAATAPLAELVELLNANPATVARLEELSALAASYRAAAAQYQKASALAERLYHVFGAAGIRADVRHLAKLVRAIELLGQTDRDVLLQRTEALAQEKHVKYLRKAAKRAGELRSARGALTQELELTGREEFTELRGHSQVLKQAGAFSFLSGRYRAAKRAYRALSPFGKASVPRMAQLLEEAADHLEQCRGFESDPRLGEICGEQFQGLLTPFDELLKIADWATEVTSALSGTEPGVRALREGVLWGDLSTLDALMGAVSDSSYGALTAVCSAAGEEADGTLAESARAFAEQAARAERACELIPQVGLRPDLPGRAAADLLQTLRELGSLEARVAADVAGRKLVGPLVSPLQAALSHAYATIEVAERVQDSALPSTVADYVFDRSARDRLRELVRIGRTMTTLAAEEAVARRAAQDSGFDAAGVLREAPEVAAVAQRVGLALRMESLLPTWAEYVEARAEVIAAELGPLLDACERENMPLSGLERAYDRVLYRSLCQELFHMHPELRRWTGVDQDQARQRFARVDSEVTALQRKSLAAQLARLRVPPGNGTGPKKEWTDLALLRHEISKKKKHLPIRTLMARAGDAIRTMKPCFMMSPLSVAQFLPPDEVAFDLVVVDEASQMRPEDALGAFGRSAQCVVVGDPMQLPPTNFFSRTEVSDDEEDDESREDDSIDSQSVLDLALVSFAPARDLRWHYRSRHESLIAFSNREFYDERLLVFPSPVPEQQELGVRLQSVAGEYKASTNLTEAEAIVEAVCRFASERGRKSLGVVAMNQKQKELIEGLIDARALREPCLEEYRAAWQNTLEPFLVKNLENVQGDERDVIFISMTYGRAPGSGAVYQRFGPINSQDGHRRLNVLFTRAKEQVVVFSSMNANDVRVDEGSKAGVRALQRYLSYAATGHMPPAGGTGRSADSVFEELVGARLREAGYEVEPQVGVQGFFIDLGIRHPRFPHGYLCGIECDGATYHSSKSARDRDRIRQEILEGLGWKLFRVWSTDWFSNPTEEMRKLLAGIEALTRG